MKRWIISCAAAVLTAALCRPIALQAETPPPQLYLTSDLVPRKGYVDESQGTKADGSVAFRECDSSPTDTAWLKKNALTPVAGTCDKTYVLWVGTVKKTTDASVTVQTSDDEALTVDLGEWQKAFGSNKAVWPKVVGGYNVERPTDLFVPSLSGSAKQF